MTDLSVFTPVPKERHVPWGTLASFALHGALALTLLLASPLRQLVVPEPQPVAVDIVTPAQYAALAAPTPAPPALTAPTGAEAAAPPVQGDRLAPAPLPPKPRPAEHPTFTATKFYSASILREPGMERIRKTMGTLADSERIVQLCNIEGLEQIRRAAPDYDPDTLVPYAMADTLAAGFTMTASGGAFRSRRKWYGIAFRCTAAADYSGVTQFAFKLGDPIPEDQWEDHNLNVEDAEE